MKSLKNDILKCLDELSGDPRLVDALNKIIEKEGKQACKAILHLLTHLNLEENEAWKSWKEIVAHRKDLNKILGRTVGLRTAICDYFSSINHALINPKVVEVMIFEKVVNDSRYDSLTGFFNRRSFDQELRRELSRAKRYGSESSLLFFDLDDFKAINDEFGHLAGDTVIKKAAAIIESQKRVEDISARYGGEEFVLLLPKTGQNEALVVGDRICKKIENGECEFEGKKIKFTLSGGLASFPADADSEIDLLNHADMALYSAKNSGKNKISVFSPEKRRFVRIELESEVKVEELGFVDAKTINAQSKNLSMGGVLFENDYPIELGKSIQLSVPIDKEEPLLVIGCVVRIEALENSNFDIGVSISLVEMEKNIKKKITKWLSLQSRL